MPELGIHSSTWRQCQLELEEVSHHCRSKGADAFLLGKTPSRPHVPGPRSCKSFTMRLSAQDALVWGWLTNNPQQQRSGVIEFDGGDKLGFFFDKSQHASVLSGVFARPGLDAGATPP